MGLLSSLFSRSGGDGGAAGGDPDPADSVAQARTRARQRLLGAVVLVGLGIVGFPLLFETQPRPIPVDVPIDIPRKESAAPLVLPSARPASGKPAVAPIANVNPNAGARPDTAQATPTATTPTKPTSPNDVITETAAEAGLAPTRPTADPRPTERAADKGPDKSVDKPADKPADKDRPADRPVTATATAGDAARAQALLDGKPAAASAAATRFIVQVGAFADPVQARETRLKVERLGLVTYTHIAQTPQGDRTRVRVGPVPTRQEAEKVAAKIKAAGLPAAILTL